MDGKFCVDCRAGIDDGLRCVDCEQVKTLRKEIAEKQDQIDDLTKKINKRFACSLCEKYDEFLDDEYYAEDGKTHLACLLKHQTGLE